MTIWTTLALVTFAAAAVTWGADFPDPALDEKPAPGTKKAVLAGGCFWCTEAVFELVEGVTQVRSGYSGGARETADYHRVTQGDTGHAEAIEITYDSSKVTYGQLLRVFFDIAHDPTTLNRQGADVGTQYRSAIFYTNDEQRRIAEAYIHQLDAAHAFKQKIVTQLTPLTAFYQAEAYHQNYAAQNPGNPYIGAVAMPKVEKFKKACPRLLRKRN